jgi:hypothetical protein
MKLQAPLLAVVAAFAAACSTPTRPTPESVENACAHRIELGYWQAFEKSLADKGIALDDVTRAEGHKGFEALMASDEGRRALAKCTQGPGKEATQAQIDCIVAAKTADEASACD